MRQDYRAWLEKQKYDSRTIGTQCSRINRVEENYGDLAELLAAGRLQSVLTAFQYSAEDKRRNRPNPSTLQINGDLSSNLASYKNSVALYRRFLEEVRGAPEPSAPIDGGIARANATDDEGAQRIGLERDLQATLRRAISQLEPNLVAIDEGVERAVESGYIDITAKDGAGMIVVIELKAGVARREAVSQILSYMGDVSAEDPTTSVRGILVASAFDAKTLAAARMVPNLSLKSYSVRFQFDDALPTPLRKLA
jgi:endonuclease NucS-like protein